MSLSLEELHELLGTRDIPGTKDEWTVLRIRVGELKALNGEEWIRENRQKLLTEWEYALRHLISASS